LFANVPEKGEKRRQTLAAGGKEEEVFTGDGFSEEGEGRTHSYLKEKKERKKGGPHISADRRRRKRKRVNDTVEAKKVLGRGRGGDSRVFRIFKKKRESENFRLEGGRQLRRRGGQVVEPFPASPRKVAHLPSYEKKKGEGGGRSLSIKL